jgi:hypothetical protein
MLAAPVAMRDRPSLPRSWSCTASDLNTSRRHGSRRSNATDPWRQPRRPGFHPYSLPHQSASRFRCQAAMMVVWNHTPGMNPVPEKRCPIARTGFANTAVANAPPICTTASRQASAVAGARQIFSTYAGAATRGSPTIRRRHIGWGSPYAAGLILDYSRSTRWAGCCNCPMMFALPARVGNVKGGERCKEQ